MGLLLYKSDEMYSSTELIRKSKMIFDKVLDHEIDKAIILRDGKPCFLLMEFQKYEKIMAEYEELKAYVESVKETATTKKSKKKQKNPQKLKEDKKPSEKKEIHTKEKIESSPVVETKKTQIEVSKTINPIPIQTITPEDKEKIEQKIHQKSDVVEEISEEQEISNALQSIEGMNFDDDMKKEAEEKIKARILQAREERAKLLADEKQNQEDLKEELILQNQLKEVKMKKDRELQEFWD